MLLQNLLYHFAFPHKRFSDPEAKTDNMFADDMNENDRDHHFLDSDPVNDDDLNENEILQQMEREDQEARRRHYFPSFRTWNSFSSTTHVSTGVSSLWLKLKRNVNLGTTSVDLETYFPNYRYLPIISGVVIPLSILLEIPGLTEDWYIKTIANKTVETKPNPPILDIGLVFSILFGLLANICLICRFTEKMVKSMTMLCIMFLTIHDMINIIAISIFGIQHRFSDGFTYGQGFWMVICSTAASSFTNVTLTFDLVLTPRFSTSGSGLTRKQRSFIISVMFLLCYIALGALVQRFLLKVTFLDALYFTVVTIETIGFGDIRPRTVVARFFVGFYTIFGIVSLALVVGLARETILEGIEAGYRKRVQMAQKRRKLLYRERRIFQRWRAAVEFRLNQMRQPIWVEDLVHEHSFLGQLNKMLPWRKGSALFFGYDGAVGNVDRSQPHGMHLNLEALSWSQLESAAMEAGAPLQRLLPPGFKTKVSFRDLDIPTHLVPPPDCPDIPLTHARLGRMIMTLSGIGIAVNETQLSKAPKPFRTVSVQLTTPGTQKPMSPASIRYESLKKTIEKEEKRAFFVRFSVVWLMFLLFWTVGSGIFTITEGWTYGTALYFCFVSFTTIGYGDYTPQTPAGRSLFIVWALLGVATMTILISILSEAYSSRYKRAFTSHVFTRAIQKHRDRTWEEFSEHQRDRTNDPKFSSYAIDEEKHVFSKQFSQSLEDSRRKAEEHITTLPHELRNQVRTFNESMQYLISRSTTVGVLEMGMPEGLKQLISDVAGVERLGERLQNEVFRDPTTRTTLLALSMEHAVRRMVFMAEEAIEAIKERDRLNDLHSARLTSMPLSSSQFNCQSFDRSTINDAEIVQTPVRCH